MSKHVEVYGQWNSPIQLEELFARPGAPMYPISHNNKIYWIEARAKEGGRQVLMRQEQDGSEHCLTPEKFNTPV